MNIFSAKTFINTTLGICVCVCMVIALSLTYNVQPAHAESCGEPTRMGFPTWYNGLDCDAEGTVIIPKGDAGFAAIWTIVLNFVGMLLVAAGYVAAGFFMWGGFNYIISTGDPGKVAAAKNTLLNSVVGLVIALASVGILDFVQKAIQGAAQ